MFEKFLQTLSDNEPLISAIAGLITLLAAIWGLVQLTFIPRRRVDVDPGDGDARAGRIRSLVNLGLSEHSELEELVSVRTVNVALLCVVVLSLTWLAFALVVGERLLLAMTNLLVFLTCLIAFAFQSRGDSYTARWLALIAMAAYWLATCALLGRFSGVEYFFAALVAIPILIFGRTELPHTCLAIALMAGLFPLAVYLQSFPGLAVELSEGEARLAYYLNACFLAMAVYAPVHFYNGFAASSYGELERHKRKADELVHNILPPHLARRMAAQEDAVADWHQEASVLLATIKGFERLHRRMSATDLVALLGKLYEQFDELVRKYGVEKVHTLGMNYVAATGISPEKPADHHALAEFAIAMNEAVAGFAKQVGHPLSLRIGISTGQAVTGVIGRTRPIFDIWGETVELANALRDVASDNAIVVDEPAYWRLQDQYQFADIDGRSGYTLLAEGAGNG